MEWPQHIVALVLPTRLSTSASPVETTLLLVRDYSVAEAEVLFITPGPSRQSPWGEARELWGLGSAAGVSAGVRDEKHP